MALLHSFSPWATVASPALQRIDKSLASADNHAEGLRVGRRSSISLAHISSTHIKRRNPLSISPSTNHSISKSCTSGRVSRSARWLSSGVPRVQVSASASVAELEELVFPAFLPESVKELTEPAARNLAAKIQRVPVQTSLAAEPIMTSCVVPENAGQEAMPVLLLHSFDGSVLEWRRAHPLLQQDGAEAWVVDTLGWGFSLTGSGSGVTTFSAEAKREHLYQFWKQYIKRPVLVVGPSLGGAAAIDFAVTHPDAVAKLALIDAQAFVEGVGNMASLPRLLAYSGVAVLKSEMLRSYAVSVVFHDRAQATKDAMRVGRLHCNMPGWSDAMVSFMNSGGYRVADLVPQVQQEALIIWGEQDKVLEKELGERLERELLRGKLRVIPDCGHLPHVEKAKAVADLLTEFAGSLKS